MPDKRIRVWVQRFNGRKHLMLQWTDPDTGKRKSRSAETDDEAKAEDARADLEADLNAGRYQEASRMSWERFRELFEAEYLPGVRPGTRECYRNVMNLFERLCGPKQVRAITPRTISVFLNGLRQMKVRGGKVGMKASSIHARLRYLHGVLGWAVEQELLPKVPAFPTVSVPKKTPAAVPVETFERLLDKAPDAQMRAFLLCGWLAGLRLNEAFELEWAETTEAPWVDFGRNRVWLPAEFVKADEDQWVPLDPALRATLEALPRRGAKVFHFTSQRGGGSDLTITADGVGYRVVRLAKRAGVRLSMHALRRGFGCRYAGRVSAHVLKKLMRHGDIRTTLDYYANVDDAVEEAVLGQRNTSRNTPAFGASAREVVP